MLSALVAIVLSTHSPAALRELARAAEVAYERADEPAQALPLLEGAVGELRELQKSPALALSLDRAQAEEELAAALVAARGDDEPGLRASANALSAALGEVLAEREPRLLSTLYQIEVLLREVRVDAEAGTLSDEGPALRSAQPLWSRLSQGAPFVGSPAAAQFGMELSAVSQAVETGNTDLLRRALPQAEEALQDLEDEAAAWLHVRRPVASSRPRR